MGAGCFILVVYLAIAVLFIAGSWKVYVKAGQPGWGCIIPIYNFYLLCKITGRPWWWLLLCLIPIVGAIIYIIMMIDLAKCFGRGAGTAVGLVLLNPIFMCILGFGSAEYQGPSAS